jgi:uncharacterized protein (DUF885 family)
MTMIRLWIGTALAALAAGGFASTPAPAPLVVAAPATAPAATQADAGARLEALFKESDEANLRRNPIEALLRGDLRYAGEFGDYVTPAYFEAEREAAARDLERLQAIDRSSLNPTQQIAYDVFRWQAEQSLKSYSPEILSLTSVRPIDHKTGYQTFFPDISSGRGAAPFKTVADYEAGLSRIPGFTAYLDNSIAQFRRGMASGVVQPKLVVDVVVEQLDALIAQGVEKSTLYGPINAFPETIGAADRARLTAAYAQAIRTDYIPGLKRLRAFLVNEYRPVARESVGLGEMKGGAALYRHMVEQRTTLPLDPEEVHQIGLREVARIRGEMERIKTQVGFKGTLNQFFEHIRTDPKFKPASRDALTQGYYAIGKKVDARIGELFSTVPKTALRIEPVPAYREKSAAGGSYQQGAPDASRPGTFFFNAYDLPSRTTQGMETLYLHEGSPGHHFQISLAQENTALPDFMRFGGNTAFVEGWALYAESLGPELGLFTDPYQAFGTLDDEMFRAVRLVVDTGLHAKGWSKERAVNYMLANTAQSRTEAESEINRYIANPGQALAYKIGQLKMRELRTRAEQALGPRFDVRDFHAQVLMTGALPLAILEQKIDRWIAAKKAA